MKKILGILLTAMMLLTSVSVLAEEEEVTPTTLPVFDGFEDNEERFFTFKNDHGISIVEAENNVVPVNGTKMLKFVDASSERRADLITGNIVLEENSKYKISFYHYAKLTGTNVGKAPYIYFDCGNAYIRNVNRNIIATATTNLEWKKYELFFVTGKDVTSCTFSFAHRTNESGTEYYDDFKIEKLNGASISFYTATVANQDTNTITRMDQYNQSRASYYDPETTYAIGTKMPAIYPVHITGIDVKSVSDAIVGGVKQDIKVATQYTPKTAGERATLLVGIYKNDANGTPILQKIKMDTWDYPTEQIAENKVENAAAHERLGVGINYITVAASEYDADCYIKAFMVNNFADLNSISDIVTLPNAQ